MEHCNLESHDSMLYQTGIKTIIDMNYEGTCREDLGPPHNIPHRAPPVIRSICHCTLLSLGPLSPGLCHWGPHYHALNFGLPLLNHIARPPSIGVEQ